MATKVILLDTDALIEYIRGNEDMQKVFDSITDKYVYINPIIKAEVQSACVGKAELNKINNFLDSIPIFNLDIETSEIFSQLFEKYTLSHKCKVPDTLIAAMCIRYDMHLFTLNKKDFSYIEGLKLIPHQVLPLPRYSGSWFSF